MKIYIVRHGQTDANLNHILQGVMDFPLNQTGRQQAQKIANRLRLTHLDAIFTSPLKRAKATAKAIAKYHPQTKFKLESELKELNFGKYEGMKFEEIIHKDNQWDSYSPHEKFTSVPPGGISREQKVERLLPILKRWQKKYKDKTILLVTHGGTKACILIALKIISIEESQDVRFNNTSLTIVRPFDTDQIELLNDTSHLDS